MRRTLITSNFEDLLPSVYHEGLVVFIDDDFIASPKPSNEMLELIEHEINEVLIPVTERFLSPVE